VFVDDHPRSSIDSSSRASSSAMASRSFGRPAARLVLEPLEIEKPAAQAEGLQLDRVRQQGAVVAAPDDLAEEVEVAGSSATCSVSSRIEYSRIETSSNLEELHERSISGRRQR